MCKASANDTHLIEIIPDHLLQEWRLGPLRFASSVPEVELQGDIITLRWGNETIQAKVNDCHFRVGRAWQMKKNSRSARPLLPFGKTDLILIDFPPLKRGLFGKIRSYNTAPVGYTKESLAKWNEALGNVIK
jgi:hypothetical protein